MTDRSPDTPLVTDDYSRRGGHRMTAPLGPDTHITEDSEASPVTERWVSSTPDEVSRHSGDGHRYARWGQCVISYDEERDPIPAVYSSAWGGGEIEFGGESTWRLTLDETEAFIQRLQNAVAYERAQEGGEPDA